MAKTPAKAGQQLTPATESGDGLLPATAFDDAGGSGYEHVTAADLLIPRLTILQGLSPQVSQGRPEFDPKAKVGMIYDVGLQQGFEDGIEIIPVHYNKVWLEWAPRASGKGVVNTHADAKILQETTPDSMGKPTLGNGNYIAETAQLYVLNVTADWRKSFIPMASTQLKKARRLLTLAMSEKIEGTGDIAPLYYRFYKLSTVPEFNQQGNWMGWKIERGDKLTTAGNWKRILQDVKEFRKMLLAGEARGDMSGTDTESAAGGGGSRRHNEEVPF